MQTLKDLIFIVVERKLQCKVRFVTDETAGRTNTDRYTLIM